MKSYIIIPLVAYAVLSLFAFEFRTLAGDCKPRYIDYVFPASLLYCERTPAYTYQLSGKTIITCPKTCVQRKDERGEWCVCANGLEVGAP